MAESILHFCAVTLKINGTGNCDMTMIGLDSVKTRSLSPLVMNATNSREPTVLTNFNSQRARLRMETDVIDEYMRVNRIVLWIKERATSFPRGGR